jgi:zinc transporter 1/2/3
MDRWVAKVISLVVIFLLTSVACLLPLRLHGVFTRWGMRGAHLLALVTCFSGGVFLALFLLHMAPESAELINRAIIIPYKLNYPLAEVLVAAAFFLMLLMELWIKSMRSGALSSDAAQLQLTDGTEKSEYESLPQPPEESELESGTSGMSGAMVLLLALSLHHIFEGISLGLKDTSEDVWKLTVAIVCHEMIIAFSLGLQLVAAFGSSNAKMVVIPGVLCQLMTPLGVMTGILLSEYSAQDTPGVLMANGVLHCLSTGVFLYVTFCEILMEQYYDLPTPGKCLNILLGFTLMALLMLIQGHGVQLRCSHLRT